MAELRARIAALEAARAASARRRRRLALAALGLAVVSGTVASAANGNCPNGLPFCFGPDSPARASEVNHNFSQLKEWLETKVGPTSAAGVSASTLTASGALNANGFLSANAGARVSGGGLQVHATGAVAPAASAGRALWVTGATMNYDSPIVDIRHDNLTQGMGFGWNSIVATGSLPDQHIFLKPKGTGVVQVQGNLEVTGRISLPSRSCRNVQTPCDSQGGGQAIYLDRHNVACNTDEFLRRFKLQTCSGGMQFDYTCCPI